MSLAGIEGALMAYGNGITTRKARALGETLESRQKEEKAELREHCEEFVSILVYQMVSSMRKTIQRTGLIDGGNAERIFQGMLDQEYAMDITKNSKFDLVDQLYDQLSHGMGQIVNELPPSEL